jgi:hypothetical protein
MTTTNAGRLVMLSQGEVATIRAEIERLEKALENAQIAVSGIESKLGSRKRNRS